jgi:hypothetical protein
MRWWPRLEWTNSGIGRERANAFEGLELSEEVESFDVAALTGREAEVVVVGADVGARPLLFNGQAQGRWRVRRMLRHVVGG